MPSLDDFLFGSEGDRATSFDMTPEAFRGLQDPVANRIRQLIANSGGPRGENQITPIPTAPITGAEQSLIDRITQLGGTISPFRRNAGDQLNETLRGDYLQPGSNPFLRGAIRAATRPVIETYQDVTLPHLRDQFTLAGQTVQPNSSSPFEAATLKAGRQAAQDVADISTQIAAANYEQERQRQLQAASQVPALTASDIQESMTALQAAALPRLVEQLGLDQGNAEFQRRMQMLLSVLGLGAQVSQPTTGQIGGTAGTQGLIPEAGSAAAGAFLNPFLGALGQFGGSIAGSFF